MGRKSGSHAQTTGPKVRAAASQLIAEHGFAAVSMRQIASEIGMQAGALYLYTPDKQTLLFDLMRTHMDQQLAAWSDVSLGTTPLERLENFCRFHIEYHLENPDQVFISEMEMRNLTAENLQMIVGLRNAYESELEQIIRDGKQADLFKIADVKLVTKAIIAMLRGVNSWNQEGGRISAERVEKIYWNLVRRAVGA